MTDSPGTKTLEAAMYAHDLLDRAVAIHDYLFKFRLRRLIPFVGEKIPFGLVADDLSQIALSSAEARDGLTDIHEPTTLSVAVDRFLEALGASSRQLLRICTHLEEKANGENQYQRAEYVLDLREYELLVRERSEAGLVLQRALSELPGPRSPRVST